MNLLLEKYNDYYSMTKFKFSYNISNGIYNYLAIAEAPNGTYYVESFFASKADSYIRNQKTLKVDSFKILHDSGDVYLEDTF